MNYDDILHLLYLEGIAQTQFFKELHNLIVAKDRQQYISLLIEKTNCSYDDAKIVCDYIIDDVPLPPKHTPEEIAAFNAKEAYYQQTRPRCPICTSTNLSKISMINKIAKVQMFGIYGADNIGKTWKCNNCGSKF